MQLTEAQVEVTGVLGAIVSKTKVAATPRTELPVVVIGAGPVGLAAAAYLVERGIPFLIIEAGERVGANLLNYGHVSLFSPWRYNIDSAVARILQPTGWSRPQDDEMPTASEIVEQVLAPFAAIPAIASALRPNARVTAVSRDGFDKVKTEGRDDAPFVVRYQRDAVEFELRARAVIDATGTWRMPNPLGASGIKAAGEEENARSIFYGIPDILGLDRGRYAGKRTLVVGAGHSAANSLIALATLAKELASTRLVWAVRKLSETRVFGGGASDALPARAALGSRLRELRDTGALEYVSDFRVQSITRIDDKLTVVGRSADGRTVQLHDIDEIICATGQRPDLTLAAELRVRLDSWLESTEALGPLIDPNLHSCGTVRPHGHRELAHPEKDFYTIGVKSYGRAPTFLMTTGFEQARSVVAAIAGDLEAADRVELDLPKTGVCSAPRVKSGSGSCCGSAVSQPAATTCGKPSPSVETAKAETQCCA